MGAASQVVEVVDVPRAALRLLLALPPEERLAVLVRFCKGCAADLHAHRGEMDPALRLLEGVTVVYLLLAFYIGGAFGVLALICGEIWTGLQSTRWTAALLWPAIPAFVLVDHVRDSFKRRRQQEP